MNGSVNILIVEVSHRHVDLITALFCALYTGHDVLRLYTELLGLS